MDQKKCKQILVHHMRPSLLQFGGKDHIIFQHDNDPKHTDKRFYMLFYINVLPKAGIELQAFY